MSCTRHGLSAHTSLRLKPGHPSGQQIAARLNQRVQSCHDTGTRTHINQHTKNATHQPAQQMLSRFCSSRLHPYQPTLNEFHAPISAPNPARPKLAHQILPRPNQRTKSCHATISAPNATTPNSAHQMLPRPNQRTKCCHATIGGPNPATHLSTQMLPRPNRRVQYRHTRPACKRDAPASTQPSHMQLLPAWQRKGSYCLLLPARQREGSYRLLQPGAERPWYCLGSDTCCLGSDACCLGSDACCLGSAARGR